MSTVHVISQDRPVARTTRRQRAFPPRVVMVGCAALALLAWDATRAADMRHAILLDEVRQIRFTHHLSDAEEPNAEVTIRIAKPGAYPAQAIETVPLRLDGSTSVRVAYMEFNQHQLERLVSSLNGARIWRHSSSEARSGVMGHWHISVVLQRAATPSTQTEIVVTIPFGEESLLATADQELAELLEGLTPDCLH